MAKRRIDKLRRLERVAWAAFVQYPDALLITESLYPSLHGETGAGILEVIVQAFPEKKVPIKIELSFANYWLSCEYAYVVNLDTKALEVFSGAEGKTPGHRFGDVGKADDTVPSFISSFKFSELQGMKSKQEFVDQVNRDLHKKNVGVRATHSNIHRQYAYRSVQDNL